MSRTDAVRAVFLNAPGQWISALDLMQVGGALAWRTEVSRCRQQYGMQLENRLTLHPRYGKVSEYRYVPPSDGKLPFYLGNTGESCENERVR